MMLGNFLGIFNFRKDGVVDVVDAMLLSMNSALGSKSLALPFVGLIFKLVSIGSRLEQRRKDFALFDSGEFSFLGVGRFLLLGIVDTTGTCSSVSGILCRGDGRSEEILAAPRRVPAGHVVGFLGIPTGGTLGTLGALMMLLLL